MRIPWLNLGAIVASVAAVAVIASNNVKGYAAHHILNPTRELYSKLNPAFVAGCASRMAAPRRRGARWRPAQSRPTW